MTSFLMKAKFRNRRYERSMASFNMETYDAGCAPSPQIMVALEYRRSNYFQRTWAQIIFNEDNVYQTHAADLLGNRHHCIEVPCQDYCVGISTIFGIYRALLVDMTFLLISKDSNGKSSMYKLHILHSWDS